MLGQCLQRVRLLVVFCSLLHYHINLLLCFMPFNNLTGQGERRLELFCCWGEGRARAIYRA